MLFPWTENPPCPGDEWFIDTVYAAALQRREDDEADQPEGPAP